MAATIVSMPSLGSSSMANEAGSLQQKVKLRLCYGGLFEQTANNSYKYVGGEYFNESIPYGIRYADFMFKLSEKFKTAVSVKYHAPGEELVPDQLISVQDDADLQELVEDYVAHLQRPGTPCKTFRIKVFVFMAAEEPLTPDEIMEGQHFFSECQLGMPARLNAVRLLDGRSSFGSTLSSVGTPSTRQQDLSAGDWPPNSAGQGAGGVAGLEEFDAAAVALASAAAEGFNEQELLERMRTAVSSNPPPRMRQQQRRLSALTTADAAAAGVALAPGDAASPTGPLPVRRLPSGASSAAGGAVGSRGAGAGGGDDSAFEEELLCASSNMLRQISQEMDEVLEAIDAQQKQDAAAAVATITEVQQAAVLDVLREAAVAAARAEQQQQQQGGYYGGEEDEGGDEYECGEDASEYQSDAQHSSRTPYTDVWEGEEEDVSVHIHEASSCQQQRDQLLPADQPHWQLEQLSSRAAGDSVDSMVRALPSHISDFGECPPDEDDGAACGDGGGAQAAAVSAAAAGGGGVQGTAAGGAGAGAAADGGGVEDGAPHLPSHISAFGDDLGPLPGGRALLSGGGEAEDGLTDLDSRLSGGQLGYTRPRTQDSSFSLDGGAFEGEGGATGAAGGINAERAGSGDSLTSLPKLQPVHRLAKPDLKIVQRIGEGAFGEVSVAKAPLYGTVAVKWLKSERFNKHFASFGREAALLADLNHPNVLRFYGVVTESAADSSVIGIMTEYIRGGSMSSFLRMSRTLLPLRVRCELALGAANGLAYLHELRIVHFDLKPDNLLLDAPPAVVRAAAGSGTEELPNNRRASLPAAGGAGGVGGGAAGSEQDDESSRGGVGAGGVAGSGNSSLSPDGLQRGGSGVAAAGGGGGAGTAASSPATGAPRGGAGAATSNRRNSSGPGVGGSGSSGLMESSELPVVKVADFGLSKHKLNSSYVSSCRDLRGTLPYMAPELVSDPERVCEKADVWSLGVVMWEMLTRQTPFQDLAPQQILLGLMCGNLHLDIPEWCEPEWRFLLEACMEPNPNNRPTMRELARQLEAIRDQQLQHEQELEEIETQRQQQAQAQAQEQQQQQGSKGAIKLLQQGVERPSQQPPQHDQQQLVVEQVPQQPQVMLPLQQQTAPCAVVQQEALGLLQAAAVSLQPADGAGLQHHHQQQQPQLLPPLHPSSPPLQQHQHQPLVVVPAAVDVQQVSSLPPPLLSPLSPLQAPPQLPVQLLSPLSHQQHQQPLLINPHQPAVDSTAKAGVFGAGGGVCDHYWQPQPSPHGGLGGGTAAGGALGVSLPPLHPQHL